MKFPPEAETKQSGLCDDGVEEAKAELYHEQAEELRREREKEEGKRADGARS